MRINKTSQTNEMTVSEIFEQFESKPCNIGIEIGITASISLDSCFLDFEKNDDFIDGDGNDYGVYDELTIESNGSESIIQLGELEEVSVDESKTRLEFDNDITLTIETI